jgi:F-type H+-transporting ATPase subunit O
MVEDSVYGKYAGVLFSVASQSEALNTVLEDMQFFRELNKESEAFRNFLGNTSFKRSEQT